MKELNLEERKNIQMEMLQEIDMFCKRNNIHYSLAFGTLLGAIRHKGFIPWDDDVDIMMPIADMKRFKELFVSDKLKYCDVDTEPHFEYAFSRIANRFTYNKMGKYKSYGICIDLYPIIPIPSDLNEQEKFFATAQKYQETRLRFKQLRRRVLKYLPIPTIPGHDRAIRRYRDYMLDVDKYVSSGKYYIIAGPLSLRNKMTYDLDLFAETIHVKFENMEFPAIANYDYYLKLRYGNYMQFPPEQERHPYHGRHYYWKKK